MKNITCKLSAITIFLSFVFHNNISADEIVSDSVSIGASSYNADWYLPSGDAVGLVYLQHGFARGSGNLRDIGENLMSKGLMVLSINANMAGGNEDLAIQAADALIEATLTPPNNLPLPNTLVLAGHSAGALHATVMGARMAERSFSDFSGAILFDPVDANSLMAPATQNIVDYGRPVYAMLANGGSCNSNNNAEPILAGISGTNFIGFKLTSGSTHVDAEGANSDFFARLFCGIPSTANVTDLQDFSAAWAIDMATGSYSGNFYPGGTIMDTIIDTNRGYLLQ